MKEKGKNVMNLIAFENDRKTNGITMKEIADALNISERTLGRWLEDHDDEKEKKILDAVERIKALKS